MPQLVQEEGVTVHASYSAVEILVQRRVDPWLSGRLDLCPRFASASTLGQRPCVVKRLGSLD